MLPTPDPTCRGSGLLMQGFLSFLRTVITVSKAGTLAKAKQGHYAGADRDRRETIRLILLFWLGFASEARSHVSPLPSCTKLGMFPAGAVLVLQAGLGEGS